MENVTGIENVSGLTKVLTSDGNYYLDEGLVGQLENIFDVFAHITWAVVGKPAHNKPKI